MSVASELHALQDVDLALDRVRFRLREIEEVLEETEELIEARQAVEEKTKVVDGLRSRQSEHEWDVEEVRTKAADIEGKLYGGRVTSPKELSDLDADLKSLKVLTARREDVLLSLMVEIEAAEAERADAAGRYQAIERDWNQHHEELLAEKERLLPEEAALKARREATAATIDKRAVSLYSLLRERKGGMAVATVERGMCQGCRITLPAAVLQKARGSAGMVQCVSCERILLVN